MSLSTIINLAVFDLIARCVPSIFIYIGPENGACWITFISFPGRHPISKNFIGISIDETSLNAYEVRKHCYETIGKRCVIKTHSQEVFKKYTWIFAISTKGVIGYEIYDKGGIDSVS